MKPSQWAARGEAAWLKPWKRDLERERAEYADYCRRFDAAVATALEDGHRAVEAAREEAA